MKYQFYRSGDLNRHRENEKQTLDTHQELLPSVCEKGPQTYVEHSQMIYIMIYKHCSDV